ncbi:MAG TPA: hypothetical protein VIJ55_01610 [Acetobacteraceae bacterium]
MMRLAVLGRIFVLLVVTLLSGMSAQAALSAPTLQPCSAAIALNGHGSAPAPPPCPLSGLAGCAATTGCVTAIADAAGADVQSAPHVSRLAWYAAPPATIAGRTVRPELSPPIPSV